MGLCDINLRREGAGTDFNYMPSESIIHAYVVKTQGKLDAEVLGELPWLAILCVLSHTDVQGCKSEY